MQSKCRRRDFLKVAAGAAALGPGSIHSAFAAEGAPASSARGASKARFVKGIRVNVLPKGLSYLESFKLARRAGYEQVEPFATADQKEAEEIKKAAREAGIAIGSVANPVANWHDPISSGDPAIVEKGIEGQELALKNASFWGGQAILMIPAIVKPSVSYRQAWLRSQKQIRRLIPLAEKLNVSIAFEEIGIENKFLLSPLEFASYIDEFKSPWVRSYFDVGNAARYAYPQDWIHTLGRRIVKVHLKDYDPKTNRFVNLGDGIVDWAAVRQAFIDVGYHGTVTVELPPGDEVYLRDISERVDRLLL